jgi:hypothetical protein
MKLPSLMFPKDGKRSPPRKTAAGFSSRIFEKRV